jgi:hypothetical protein
MKRSYRYIIAGALIVLLYIVLRLNLIGVPLDRDEGAFGYIGQVILDHGLPYKDALDHKPPVVFYLYAFALLFVPPTPAGIHVFLQAYNFITLVLLFFLAKVYFRSLSAGLWTALAYAVLSASSAIQGFTASTEMFMLLPITLSLLLAVLSMERKNLFYAFASGVSGALACWTKQTAAFSIAFVMLCLAARQLSPAKGEGAWRLRDAAAPMLFWLAGAACVSLAIMAYFYFKGIFGEFFYWSFTHSLYYAGEIGDGKFRYVLGEIANILKENFFPLAAGTLYGAFALLKKDRRGFFTTGFLIFSFLGALPGFAYRHYFAQAAPAIALAAGFAIQDLLGKAPAGLRKFATVFTAAAVIITPLALNSQYYFETDPGKISRSLFGYNPFPESIALGDYIARHTDPGDKVFIFGSEPQILFYARRRSASPSVMLYPLTSSYPRQGEHQKMVWNGIAGAPPKYVMYVDLPASIQWDGKAAVMILQLLDQLVDKDYHLEAEMTIGKKRSVLRRLPRAGAGGDDDTEPLYSISLYRRNN